MPGRKKKSEVAADEPGDQQQENVVEGAVLPEEETKVNSGEAAAAGNAVDAADDAEVPSTDQKPKKAPRKSKAPKEPAASRPRKEGAKGAAKGNKR